MREWQEVLSLLQSTQPLRFVFFLTWPIPPFFSIEVFESPQPLQLHT
jgi:hypothetical protein